jgi:hypothetical protein
VEGFVQKPPKKGAAKRFAIDARVDAEALIARMRESAQRRRARVTDRSAEIVADGEYISLNSVIEAQADFNRSIIHSLRLVAQHLQYVQKNFAAIKESQQQETERQERAGQEVGEQVAQLSATLEEVSKSFEEIVARLSGMEQRMERELNEIRQSIREWRLSAGGSGE